jgi:hypothetical protein
MPNPIFVHSLHDDIKMTDSDRRANFATDVPAPVFSSRAVLGQEAAVLIA